MNTKSVNITIRIEVLEGDIMHIKDLKIHGIGGIRDLEISFIDGLNVICGANGIGKTTILNIIADAFANSERVLKKNANSDYGRYNIKYLNAENSITEVCFDVNAFEPNNNEYLGNAKDESRYVLTFGINRMIDYMQLQAIPMDIKRDIYDSANVVRTGIGAESVKGWFVNRYVFYDKQDSMSDEQKDNFELAKESFGILDSQMKFHTVKSGSLDIMLTSPQGNIYFEYLSAGYKTCVYIVLGILEELEFRFTDPYICARDFNGIIIIDEIELHLHPLWQAKLVLALKRLFTKAQIIVTTHSPSVLQVLEKEEIIPLFEDGEMGIKIKDLSIGEYGLQGWTLEEILQDVMGMPNTTSEMYQNTIDAFDKALYDENIEEIKKNYDILNKMLHPKSTLRKLLQIQMAGLEE